MKVLVTGATGFVGGALAAELDRRGHEVVAMTRHPDSYDGPGEARRGDVTDPRSLPAAFDGCDVAVYLVHSLSHVDFVRRDADAARWFGSAAREAGVGRIVYLGGLGDEDDDLSAHLRSRRDVEHLLRESGVPVVALRAGVVIGHSGLSWEMTRQLVQRLAIMATPKWVRTLTQPLALPDAVDLLAAAVERPDVLEVYEVGGPDVLTYEDMMLRAGACMGRRPRVVPVPLLSPRLSSYWLALVSGELDVPAARSLVDSMTNEVVVRDMGPCRDLLGREPMGYEESIDLALRRRREAQEAAA